MELKPCPFCGGEAYVARDRLAQYHGGYVWFGCGCKRCRVQYRTLSDTEEEAIGLWNRRAYE